MPNYRIMIWIGVALFAALFLAYTFAPQPMLHTYGVELDPSAAFVSHRAGGTMLGLAALLFLARGVTEQAARAAIMTGCAVICGYLACLGTWEYLTGHAGPGMFGAVGVEVLLTAGFFVARKR